MKYTVGWLFFVFVILVSGGWLIRAHYLLSESIFAPREEAVRRQAFEESKAYNQGVAQELQSMQFEYIKATVEQKAALKSVILQRAAGYDVSRLPAETQQFLSSLK